MLGLEKWVQGMNLEYTIKTNYTSSKRVFKYITHTTATCIDCSS